ncbi:unnamed protein product [Boreogadus saida]
MEDSRNTKESWWVLLLVLYAAPPPRGTITAAAEWWCLGAARCQGSGASAAGSGAPAGDNRDQQSRATIPFSSMSRFSLPQIDADVEEPETTENPTQSFEIPIVWRRTQLLAVIV